MRSRLGSCLLLTASLCACESAGGGASLADEATDAGADATVDASADASKSTARRDATTTNPGSYDASLTDDNACAATTVAAQQVVVTEEVPVTTTITTPAPVALYVMFDHSMSMAGPPFGTANIWPAAVTAIKSFVNDSSSAGMDIALQYFPIAGGQCGGAGYSTPAVAMGRLPAQATAISSSLDRTSANGTSTPIEGALRGVTSYCLSYQSTHPDEKCIAVLVTDGKPELDGCSHDTNTLAGIAGAAYASGVRTFAVGLNGADFTLLDAIAMAGGAADCDPTSARFSCDVSSGADKLSAALAKIRDSVTTTTTHTETVTHTVTHPLDCQWLMPAPSDGQTLDKDRVNVTLSGTQSLALGRVPSADKCQDAAWYYDNDAAPTQLQACPTTCDAIKAGTYTDVKILLGCETKVLTVF